MHTNARLTLPHHPRIGDGDAVDTESVLLIVAVGRISPSTAVFRIVCIFSVPPRLFPPTAQRVELIT